MAANLAATAIEPREARHSAASVMLAPGVPLEVVSEVLGHSSISGAGLGSPRTA